VAPAEAEKASPAHPDIVDATVTAIPDIQSGERPKAPVAVRPRGDLTEAGIQTFPAGRLAPFKRPTVSAIVD